MDAKDIRSLEPLLDRFVGKFTDCFPGCEVESLGLAYMRGLLSDLERKNVERIALRSHVAPRTLQEFLASYDWDDNKMRQKLHEIVASDHACVHSVGIIDETSAVKKGDKTPGVQRQYCGAVGKQENCVVTVHLSYEAMGFRCLLDGDLFLPESWSEDRERCRASKIPDSVVYRPKSDIALELYYRSVAHGIKFEWLTFDEWYGAKPQFLSALVRNDQKYVGEIHGGHRIWGKAPKVTNRQYKTRGKRKSKKTPRILAGSAKASTVKDFVERSPELRQQSWTRWHVKDTAKGPKVVECKTAVVYPQNDQRLPCKAHIVLVVKDVLSHELKYFLCYAPPNTSTGVLLKVAFSRWSVERCFEDDKNYVGFDHFEGRSYPGFMRHILLSAVALLFLSQCRQELLPKLPELTISQVRQATSALIESWWLPKISPTSLIDDASFRIDYYQNRNAQARKSHTKTRVAKLEKEGVDMQSTKKCQWDDS